jgi:hypothetical protein
MLHTLVSLFFVYLFLMLFMMFEVLAADSGLLGYDSMFELVHFTILHSIVSQKT